MLILPGVTSKKGRTRPAIRKHELRLQQESRREAGFAVKPELKYGRIDKRRSNLL